MPTLKLMSGFFVWSVVHSLYMKRYFLAALGIVFILMAKSGPMSLMFALWIFVYLWKEKLTVFASRFPRWVAFIGFGTLFGLLIEVFAIFANLSLPPEQRILIDPNPARDLFFAVFSYGMFVVVWYFLLKRRNFSSLQIVLASGVYGILTEQFNPALGGPVILLNIFREPASGIGYALLVIFVYGIFPMLAYMLTEPQFGERKKASALSWIFAVVALWLQWAVYGNFVLPALKAIV